MAKTVRFNCLGTAHLTGLHLMDYLERTCWSEGTSCGVSGTTGD